MVEIRLSPRTVFPWHTTNGTSTCGEWPQACSAKVAASTPEGRLDAFRRASGSFGWVSREPDGVVHAAVDARRSFPLFWAERDSRVLVCDDAREAASFAGEAPLDPVSVAEAMACGFVTGHATLVPRVHQVGAGEILRVEPSAGGARITLCEWALDGPCGEGSRRGQPSRAAPPAESSRIDELEEILRDVAHRLFASVEGRQVVIPLTGGHDSRLLAILAKQAGYDRVICIGSGRANHWETRIAREVAERLGFPYSLFGFEPRQWREWYASPERRTYYRRADGLSTLPSMIECPALLGLRESGLVGDEGIIMTGHFGSQVTGTFPSPGKGTRHTDALSCAMQSILDSRYALNRLPRRHTPLGRELANRLRSSLTAAGGAEGATVDELIRRWELKEHHPKRIGSTVRACEHFGFEWRLPFLDPRLVAFWRAASPHELFENRLHHEYVQHAGEPWGLPAANPGVVPLSRRRGRTWLRRLGLLGPARHARHLLRRLDGRGIERADALGWSCLFRRADVSKSYTGREGGESYLIRDWLSELERDARTG